MNILEALKQLRDDIKTWVTNNLRELNDRKLDKEVAAQIYPSRVEIGNSIETQSLTVGGKTINEIIVETVGDSSTSEEVTAAAFNAHVDDGVIHVTAADRTTWDAKVDATTVDTKINTAITDGNFVTQTELNAHTIETSVHISSDERNTWNAKVDSSYVQTQISNAISDGNFVTQTELSAHTLADGVHVSTSEKETWSAKADAEHTHEISDIDGLQDALNNSVSGTQSDMAINDSTDAAYVKNRTHWIETQTVSGVDLLPETTMPIGYIAYTTSPFVLELGENYIVVFDGATNDYMECYESDGLLCLGDSTVPSRRENSTSGGEVTPTAAESTPGTFYVEYNPSTQYVKIYATDYNSHTIKISTYDEIIPTYIPLDDRFLSDGVVKPIVVDMIADGSTATYSYALSENISTLIGNGKKVVLHYNGKLYEYAGTRNKDVEDYMFMRISYTSGILEFETVEATGTYANMYTVTTASSGAATTELPEVTTADNGKFLRVVDGVWTAQSLTDVSEVGA